MIVNSFVTFLCSWWKMHFLLPSAHIYIPDLTLDYSVICLIWFVWGEMDLNSNSVLLNLLLSLQLFPRRKTCRPEAQQQSTSLAGHAALGSVSRTGEKKEETESKWDACISWERFANVHRCDIQYMLKLYSDHKFKSTPLYYRIQTLNI